MSDLVEEIEFMTKSKFGKLIESIVRDKKMSYIDAVVYACEQHNIEIEDSRKYVNIVLKQKIEAEAMQLNFLEKNAQLPFE
jgi:ribosomal protein L25 (general stress protein Ctc)